MREILFRGKSYDGEWVEGAYYKQTEYYGDAFEAHYIISSSDELEDNMMIYDQVIPETVGQYTGLTDKNGKKIFEGDILSVTVRETIKECGVRKFTGNKIKTVWSVEYAERRSQGNGFYVFGKDRRFSLGLTKSVIYNANPEVIGNIHDNPELGEAVSEMEETKIFACDNGRSYRFPAQHCLFCDNCTHVLYDYTHGPYMWLCDIGEEDFRTCGKFKEEVE